MAINIRIGTAFDGKGLGIAQRELGNLKSSVGALRSNFLLLGAALTGAAAIITTNVQSLARIETINAQTAQTITSMGNAANVSAAEVEALSGRLESLTATEAESIQEGANLLLTFGNISNQMGEGNDIFNRTTEIMVDMARVLKTGPTSEAIRLGKALNDPTVGMTALTKAGVSFTEQQKEQVRALQASGDMLGAQKLILDELQRQFGGSGAAYAKTFTGQLELMGHELGTIGEEATMAVMPALTMMIEELRELIPVIGPQLKEAIESVDWRGLVTTVVDFTTFLIENAEAIAIVVGAMFALDTMVKLVNIAIALQKVAVVLHTGVMAIFTTGVGAATGALKLFRTALITTGIGAVLVALGFLADYLINVSGATDEATESQAAFGGQVGITADQVDRLRDAQRAIPTFTMPSFTPTGGGGRANTAAQAAEAAARAAEEDARRRAEEAARAAEEARRIEQERLDKRAAAFKSFADSVASTFGQIKNSILSSFNLPTLGSSVNSITRNIQKLLDKTKGFAKSITQLSGLGLNSALLQQVIQAGPMAGSQLASAIVGGGSAFISQLNAAYGEFGNLASGIAGVGTERAFANQEVINNYYQIEVSGGVGSGPSIGKAIVDAIKSYERTSGAVWQGA
jgi:hypothetical protein